MSAFHGNFFVRSNDLLSLPAVPMDVRAEAVEDTDGMAAPQEFGQHWA